MAPDMDPLFQSIVKEIQAPVVKEDAPLQMLVGDNKGCAPAVHMLVGVIGHGVCLSRRWLGWQRVVRSA